MFYSVLLITVYISGRFEHSWFVAGVLAAVLWAVVYAAGWIGIGRMWGVAVAMIVTVVMTWKLKLNFAMGAIVSLLHDVFLTLGMLTLLNREIDLNIIAALLTLVGYSLNDTIIVFDRIRENLRNIPAKASEADVPSMGTIINLSINQTLSRTLLTSGTTLVACLSLYLLGGSVIHDFALTILLGVIIGTYSSDICGQPHSAGLRGRESVPPRVSGSLNPTNGRANTVWFKLVGATLQNGVRHGDPSASPPPTGGRACVIQRPSWGRAAVVKQRGRSMDIDILVATGNTWAVYVWPGFAACSSAMSASTGAKKRASGPTSSWPWPPL